MLIYLNVLDGFSKNISEKEREKLRKRVGKTLEKPQTRTFYDMSGKEVFTDKHFRLDYIKFHGGVTVYELKNNQTIIKPD